MASIREELVRYGKRIDAAHPVVGAGTFRGLAALDPGHQPGPQQHVKMMEDECE